MPRTWVCSGRGHSRIRIFRMKRALHILANGLAGVVLVLLLLDPTRPLALVFVLLVLAVVCAVVPRFLRG
jgi:hypothetical protein